MFFTFVFLLILFIVYIKRSVWKEGQYVSGFQE